MCRTCSACVTVPPVACNFSRVGGLWQWLGQRFGHLAKWRFHAFIAFGHPFFSSQVGRKNNTWISTLGIPPRFCASTEIGRIGEQRPGAYPVASIRQLSRFSKRADLGITRTPLLQLALRNSGLAHSHIPRQTCIATRLGRVEPHGSGPVRGPNCGHACPQGG